MKSTDITDGTRPLTAKFYPESSPAMSSVEESSMQMEKHDHTVVMNKPAINAVVNVRINAKNKNVLKPPTWDTNMGSVPFTLYKYSS